MARSHHELSILLLVAFASGKIAAAQDQTFPLPAEIARDAYELYSSILKDNSAVAINAMKIGDSAFRTTIYMRPQSDEERAMVASLRELNEHNYLLEPRFKASRVSSLLSEDDIKQKRTDGSFEYVRLSPPGFNRSHTRALIWTTHYRSIGNPCVLVEVAVYRKAKGTWVREKAAFAENTDGFSCPIDDIP